MAIIAVSLHARPGHEGTLYEKARLLCHTARTFPGYLDAHLCRGHQDDNELVAFVTFDNTEHLLDWEHSDERNRHLEECRTFMLTPSHRLSATDLHSALLGAHPDEMASPPARWKTALWVWVTLFPTATALNYFLAPSLEPLPIPVRTLITTVVTVPFLVWIAIPAAQRLCDLLLRK